MINNFWTNNFIIIIIIIIVIFQIFHLIEWCPLYLSFT